MGGAWSERATVPGAGNSTRFDATTVPPTVTGTKYYSTGSIYGDWISVAAKAADDSDVFVLVDAHGEGVELFDDWDGIGQRLTGSGTTVFDRSAVAGDAVFRSDERAPHQEIIYQIVLLTSLAGVALSARDEGAAAVRARVRNDPQGLASVGSRSLTTGCDTALITGLPIEGQVGDTAGRRHGLDVVLLLQRL